MNMDDDEVVLCQLMRLKRIRQADKTSRNDDDFTVSALECETRRYSGKNRLIRRKQCIQRIVLALLNRLRIRRCASATISSPDPNYQVAYLGNVITGWAKGEGCVEKPLATLWRNYVQSSRADVRMHLIVGGNGLRARTKDHGLTEYWAHRLTTCSAPPQFPRLFCWVYRHENRRMRHELRCHAVLCASAAIAQRIEAQLKAALALALAEFKRDKMCRQNARLSLVNSVVDNPSMPRRKILLSTAAYNYRPPLERSKSAPKLASIEEEIQPHHHQRENSIYRRILRCYNTSQSGTSKSMWSLDRSMRKPTNREVNNNNNDGVVEEEEGEESDREEVETEEIAALLLVDSDDGSLSSGCESSASTVTSDLPPLLEDEEPAHLLHHKTEQCFKVGGVVTTSHLILAPPIDQQISLIPSVEITDFNVLKMYPKKYGGDDELVQNINDSDGDNININCNNSSGNNNNNDNNAEHLIESEGDESGYEEEPPEVANSSIANVILV